MRSISREDFSRRPINEKVVVFTWESTFRCVSLCLRGTSLWVGHSCSIAEVEQVKIERTLIKKSFLPTMLMLNVLVTIMDPTLVLCDKSCKKL